MPWSVPDEDGAIAIDDIETDQGPAPATSAGVRLGDDVRDAGPEGRLGLRRTGAPSQDRSVPPTAAGRAWAGWPTTALVAGAVALVAAVVLRFVSTGPLWFDEAQSVAIAQLPLRGLFDALRQDGSPPLYYLLLHGWMAIAGSSTWAVRAFSGLVSVAEIPAAWLLARRVLPRRAVLPATALVATSPFVIRYATETRMYALVLLLVTLAGLALTAVLQRPGLPTAGRLAVASGALALTHYWALFVFAVIGTHLLVRALRGEARYLWAAAGLGGGALLFLPWLPSMLFQVHHTGTPWWHASWYDVLVAFPAWAGAERAQVAPLLPASVLFLVLVTLVVSAIVRSTLARSLFAMVVGTLLLAGVASLVLGSATDPRYTTVALLPFLFVAAIGMARLGERNRRRVLAAACLLGLIAGGFAAATPRTRAQQVAGRLAAAGSPTDIVVSCPDQIGVDVARLLPGWQRQITFPTGAAPARVDWVDYDRRNLDSHPQAFANWLVASAGTSPIWLLWSGDFREYHGRCDQLAAALARWRPVPRTLMSWSNPMEQSQTERLQRFVVAPPHRGPAALPEQGR